ncbi:MAG: hypothetical protein DGJ47_000726 [Rickettsiaceae bacterium]
MPQTPIGNFKKALQIMKKHKQSQSMISKFDPLSEGDQLNNLYSSNKEFCAYVNMVSHYYNQYISKDQSKRDPKILANHIDEPEVFYPEYVFETLKNKFDNSVTKEINGFDEIITLQTDLDVVNSSNKELEEKKSALLGSKQTMQENQSYWQYLFGNNEIIEIDKEVDDCREKIDANLGAKSSLKESIEEKKFSIFSDLLENKNDLVNQVPAQHKQMIENLLVDFNAELIEKIDVTKIQNSVEPDSPLEEPVSPLAEPDKNRENVDYMVGIVTDFYDEIKRDYKADYSEFKGEIDEIYQISLKIQQEGLSSDKTTSLQKELDDLVVDHHFLYNICEFGLQWNEKKIQSELNDLTQNAESVAQANLLGAKDHEQVQNIFKTQASNILKASEGAQKKIDDLAKQLAEVKEYRVKNEERFSKRWDFLQEKEEHISESAQSDIKWTEAKLQKVSNGNAQLGGKFKKDYQEACDQTIREELRSGLDAAIKDYDASSQKELKNNINKIIDKTSYDVKGQKLKRDFKFEEKGGVAQGVYKDLIKNIKGNKESIENKITQKATGTDAVTQKLKDLVVKCINKVFGRHASQVLEKRQNTNSLNDQRIK